MKDANEIYGEKAKWERHKNTLFYLEQILEGALQKAAAVQPPAFHLISHPSRTNKTSETLLERNDKLINDVLLWTPAHGHASVSGSAVTYIHQLCVETGCTLEDRPEAMDNRYGW